MLHPSATIALLFFVAVALERSCRRLETYAQIVPGYDDAFRPIGNRFVLATCVFSAYLLYNPTQYLFHWSVLVGSLTLIIWRSILRSRTHGRAQPRLSGRVLVALYITNWATTLIFASIVSLAILSHL